MISRYRMVTTILDCIDKNDVDRMERLLRDCRRGDDPYDLSEAILYIGICLQAKMTEEERKTFRERLTDRTVSEEIDEMFGDE